MTFTWRFNHKANPEWRTETVVALGKLVDELNSEGYDAKLTATSKDPEKAVVLKVKHTQGVNEFSALMSIEYDRGLPLRQFCNNKLFLTRMFFPVNDHDGPGPVVHFYDQRPENVLIHGFHVCEEAGRAALKKSITKWIRVENTRKLQKLQQGVRQGL